MLDDGNQREGVQQDESKKGSTNIGQLEFQFLKILQIVESTM